MEDVNRGYAGVLGIAKETVLGTAVTPATKRIAFESESFDDPMEEIVVPGITGSRGVSKARVVQGTVDPRGGFVIAGVHGADLDLLLELALGAYASGSANPAETLPPFTVVLYKPPKYDIYAGCKMASLAFESAQDAQSLKATAEIVAISRADGVLADLGSVAYATDVPFVHKRLTFRVGGTAIPIRKLGLKITNPLEDKHFANSETRQSLSENGDRVVDGDLMLTWNGTNADGIRASGRAGSFAELYAEYTNGTYVLTFIATYCRFIAERGKITGPGVMEMPVKFRAHASVDGAGDEIQIYRRDA